LSVALCTYNGERFLAEQLDSLAGQTRPPDEVIAFDDHSTDRTLEILAHFVDQATFPVQVATNTKTVGYIDNFERAIRACRGSLIALCDQDDIWAPDKLEVASDAFRSNPGLKAFFSDAEAIDDDGQVLGYTAWEAVRLTDREVDQINAGEADRRMWNAHTVTGSTLVFASDLRDVVLPFPQSLREPDSWYIHDGWIAALAAAVGPVRAERRHLVKYRVHQAQAKGLLPPEVTKAESAYRRDRSAAITIELTKARPPLARLSEVMSERPDLKPWCESAEERCRHLEARLRGRAKGGRHRVLLELASGRYRQHSKGVRSAISDLLRI
jgi:glycosyltransferase involved in cell wall biosynthesis